MKPPPLNFGAKAAAPIAKAQRLSDLVLRDLPVEPAWIGPDILPKSTKMLLGGHAKLGKSFIAMELAKALSLGRVPFNCPHFNVLGKTRVLMIEQELKIYGLQKRAKIVFDGIPTSEYEDYFFFESGNPMINFSEKEGIKLIYDLVNDVKPEVLMLDPIGKMHFYDENNATQVSKLMSELDKLVAHGRPWGMSLIYLHHFGKAPKGDAFKDYDPLDPYNFRGSSKWFDDADTLVTATKKSNVSGRGKKAWYIATRWKTRHAEEMDDIQLVFNAARKLEVSYVRDLGEEGAKTSEPIPVKIGKTKTEEPTTVAAPVPPIRTFL